MGSFAARLGATSLPCKVVAPAANHAPSVLNIAQSPKKRQSNTSTRMLPTRGFGKGFLGVFGPPPVQGRGFRQCEGCEIEGSGRDLR